MRPELRALAAVQDGLITRQQAKQVGYTERELRTMTAVHGPWVVVRRGVYCERTLWDSLTGYGERAALRDRAVHLSMRTEHLMSHDSAARALGIPMLNPRRELTHVTREGLGGTRTEHGVKHHLTRLGLLNTEVVDGMRVTGPARTALDLAREHGRDAGVIACDAVRHGGLPKEALASELLLMWCWPGVTQAKAAVALSDPGAETPGETLLRLLLLELGIGAPETQFPVQLPDSVAWIDVRIGCHGFEFDGKLKFLPVAARRCRDQTSRRHRVGRAAAPERRLRRGPRDVAGRLGRAVRRCPGAPQEAPAGGVRRHPRSVRRRTAATPGGSGRAAAGGAGVALSGTRAALADLDSRPGRCNAVLWSPLTPYSPCSASITPRYKRDSGDHGIVSTGNELR